MAKQESLIKVRGKVGDLSFSKHRSRGYEVRMKGGVDKARIQSDPNFQRTRENMAEFGSAATSAKLIRIQLNNLLRTFADNTMRNRLTALVHRIQKADSSNARGERIFLGENSAMLKGFEFNQASSLKMLLGEKLEVAYDRATGHATLVIPEFNPQNDVMLLNGATHMLFTLAAAELSTDEVPPRPVMVKSGYIPLIGVHAEETLQAPLVVDATKVVYIIVGISMYQEVNGEFYPLKNNPYNAMTIAEVDIP
ncbi:hypothetical protein BWD42_05070 [Sphingobacterium sp. CZ-UAM]|uniref:hypothetical protein n=1 Tax=Sphingobacterium sp. CZ-UAM TaxID=1933868 RepID=UPI00098570A7|nr:hypothetical protein [Sphingobacterium sp. CZ-UAM]OOG19311.1 hypothetical protein BWD42_05070 [Sphingobacterium sp. CZ-UAM]